MGLFFRVLFCFDHLQSAKHFSKQRVALKQPASCLLVMQKVAAAQKKLKTKK